MVFNVQVTYTVKLGKSSGRNLEPFLRTWQDETTVLLTRIPGPVRYPIRWTTPKQRRYVMGVVLKRDEQGNIIPTRRTGRVAEWGVFVDYQELGIIRQFTNRLTAFMANLNPFKRGNIPKIPGGDVIAAMTNNTPYQRYVTGVNQQGFHADTGWIFAPGIVNVQRRKLEGILTGELI